MTCAMLVKEPLCMRGPFNCPDGLNNSRKVGELLTVRSVAPPIAVMTPLLPAESLAKPENLWQTEQLAPPVGAVGALRKSCFPLFSLSVKFENVRPEPVTAAPASNFESNDWMLRTN